MNRYIRPTKHSGNHNIAGDGGMPVVWPVWSGADGAAVDRCVGFAERAGHHGIPVNRPVWSAARADDCGRPVDWRIRFSERVGEGGTAVARRSGFSKRAGGVPVCGWVGVSG